MDAARLVMLVISFTVLWNNSKSSSIYHWIRGQGSFKLYLLKALASVADTIFRWTSRSNLAYMNAEFSQGELKHKVSVVLYQTSFVICQSYALLMEMFVVHVALTMSPDSCFVYVLIDCFKELTLTVFKKADYNFLLATACDDSVERFQILMYVVACLLQTR